MVDFSFNGQQSYSPLLAQLANSGVVKAELAIKQDQNRRQRLSDLLTNLSNAATLGRNLKQMSAQAQLQKLASQQNPMAGAAAGANPDAYSTGVAGVTAPFMGLNAMMSGGQPSSPPLAGEGVTPGDQGNVPRGTAGNSLDVKREALMNKFLGLQYDTVNDPTTGIPYRVEKQGILPPEKISFPGSNQVITDPKNYTPNQQKELPNIQKQFAETAKPEIETLLNVSEFQNLANSNNPIADKNIRLLAPKLSGIAARANPQTLEAFGGSDAVLSKINAALERAKEGKLTKEDRSFFKDFGNTIGASANQALSQKLKDSVTAAQNGGLFSNVHPDLLNKSIGGDAADRIKNYKPLVQKTAGIMIRIQASDGTLHDIPKDKLAAAKKRDPRLKVQSGD